MMIPLSTLKKKTLVRKSKQKDPNGLPNTFIFAGEALKIMSQKGGSAGSIIVNKYKSYNYKLIYALAMNTLKNIKQIRKIIEAAKLEDRFKMTDKFVLEILVGDLLHGKGLKTVEQCTTAAELLRLKPLIEKKQSLTKNDSSPTDNDCPKYMRINYLKSSKEQIANQLKGLGFKVHEYEKSKIKFKKFINIYKSMEENEYMFDFHFPDDIILLKPTAMLKLKNSDIITKGKAVIQDKASYMAAVTLIEEKGGKYIDACCAPCGKTAIIGMMLKNKCTILGYDTDKKRLQAGQFLLKKQGVTCAKLECQDFSKIKFKRLLKHNKIDSFDGILIDPSCSGSGIANRVDYNETKEHKGRLFKLQAFQVSLLKHAIMANASKTIVYCTCSKSIEENEQVVEMALNESGMRDLWTVAEIFPFWPERGDPSYEFGSFCVRSSPTNLTNGFFIAKLVRNG